MITLDRKIAYHLTGTFFQCFVLTGVGYLTLFFAIDNFTDRIMVALTTMLVQATVSNSMQDVGGTILSYEIGFAIVFTKLN